MDISEFNYSILSANGDTMVVEYTHQNPALSVVRQVLVDLSNHPKSDYYIRKSFPCFRWCYEMGTQLPHQVLPRTVNIYCINPGDF